MRTYMLSPSADQLARWTVTACHDAGTASPQDCIKYLANFIIKASSGVFPVAGYIPEPAASAGSHGSTALSLLFRDGVTITTDIWGSRAPTGKTAAHRTRMTNPRAAPRSTPASLPRRGRNIDRREERSLSARTRMEMFAGLTLFGSCISKHGQATGTS